MSSIGVPDELDGLVATVDRLPVAESLVGGICAFVGGYVAFVATLAVTGSPNFGTPVRTLKQVGGVFYNAQNVPLIRFRRIAVGEETISQEASINVIQAGQPGLPRPVYYAIPVVVTAVVAGLLVYLYLDRTDPLETGAAVVAGTTLGYLLTALVGSFLVAQRTAQAPAVETLTPAKLWTLGYGIAYPLVITAVVVGLTVGWRRVNAETDVGPGDAQA